MELEYTGFTDRKGKRIYHNSLVRNDRGNIFVVKSDPDLSYVIVEVFEKTIEYLSIELCLDLTLIIQDVRDMRFL